MPHAKDAKCAKIGMWVARLRGRMVMGLEHGERREHGVTVDKNGHHREVREAAVPHAKDAKGAKVLA